MILKTAVHQLALETAQQLTAIAVPAIAHRHERNGHSVCHKSDGELDVEVLKLASVSTSRDGPREY